MFPLGGTRYKIKIAVRTSLFAEGDMDIKSGQRKKLKIKNRDWKFVNYPIFHKMDFSRRNLFACRPGHT